jgi:hypothetical protein
MNICFIVSSAAVGRDGVGDYTRRLAAECIRQSHRGIILALNDSCVSKSIYETQEIEGVLMSVLRLPKTMPWSERVQVGHKWLKEFKPDWVSLQFVAFGFHPKGLTFGLGKRLAEINYAAAWHVMFHELWVGWGQHAPIKRRVLGALQRKAILGLVDCLKPRMLHTQSDTYQKLLKLEGLNASILPLFGNIPRADGDGWELLKPLLDQAFIKRLSRDNLYLAGIFGAVHPEWNAEQNVDQLLPLVQGSQKLLILVFLGKNNMTTEESSKLIVSLKGRAQIVITGERTSEEISKILQSLDIGLATSPRSLIQKSGSVAAMVEHGLPVLITRDDCEIGVQSSLRTETPSNLITPPQFALLNTLPTRRATPPGGIDVQNAANSMLFSLKSGS